MLAKSYNIASSILTMMAINNFTNSSTERHSQRPLILNLSQSSSQSRSETSVSGSQEEDHADDNDEEDDSKYTYIK